jgi:hypothetical protein
MKKINKESVQVKSGKASFLKPIKNEFSVSCSRLTANIYKDVIKSYRNKKYFYFNLEIKKKCIL